MQRGGQKGGVTEKYKKELGSDDCVQYFDHDGDFTAGCVWMTKLIKVYTLCVCSLLCFECAVYCVSSVPQ